VSKEFVMPNPMSAAKQPAIDNAEYERMVDEVAEWCRYRVLVDERPVEEMMMLFTHHVVAAVKKIH
jgi:hypothetical protein